MPQRVKRIHFFLEDHAYAVALRVVSSFRMTLEDDFGAVVGRMLFEDILVMFKCDFKGRLIRGKCVQREMDDFKELGRRSGIHS